MLFEESDLLKELPKQFFAGLVAKVNAKVAEGADVINLGQGNPDQPTYDHIVEALCTSAHNPASHKYSQFRSNRPFKEAATSFYKKHYGIDLDAEREICVTGGAKIGLVELPLALMNPGDLLLLPDPGYPDYLSGAVATKAFYEKLVAWAKAYEVGVVSDLAYGALGYQGYENPSFLSVPGAKDVGIEFYTFSKTFNMAGWRLAFAAGNDQMIEALNLIQDHLFVGIFPALQDAGIAALLDPKSEEAVAKLNAVYDSRRDAFTQAAAKIGWQAFPSKGSFYAWMPVPEGYTSESFADLLLEKAHVAVAPGKGFGPAGDAYVRIGLLVEPERLVEAVNRIADLHLFDY